MTRGEAIMDTYHVEVPPGKAYDREEREALAVIEAQNDSRVYYCPPSCWFCEKDDGRFAVVHRVRKIGPEAEELWLQ